MKLQELFESEDDDEEFDLFPKLTDKNVIQAIRDYCPNNFKDMASGKAKMLWRGTEQKHTDTFYGKKVGMLVTPPRVTHRESRTGISILMDYTRFADDWKNIPDRGMSVFCATNKKNASEFADTANSTWLAVPWDNVKVFAAIKTDFNLSRIPNTKYPHAIMNLAAELAMLSGDAADLGVTAERQLDKLESNLALRALIPHLKNSVFPKVRTGQPITKKELIDFSRIVELIMKVMDPKWTSYTAVKKSLGIPKFASKDAVEEARVDDMIDHIIQLARMSDLLKDTVLGSKTILEFLEDHLNPDVLGVVTARNVRDIPDKFFQENSEVWFEGGWVGFQSMSPKLKTQDKEWMEYIVQNI